MGNKWDLQVTEPIRGMLHSATPCPSQILGRGGSWKSQLGISSGPQEPTAACWPLFKWILNRTALKDISPHDVLLSSPHCHQLLSLERILPQRRPSGGALKGAGIKPGYGKNESKCKGKKKRSCLVTVVNYFCKFSMKPVVEILFLSLLSGFIAPIRAL